MKRMKKVLAMLLAMAMVLGMSMTVFAAKGTTTITISYPGETAGDVEEVKYDQIIKENMKSTLGWEFASNDYKQAFVNGFMERDANTPVSDDEANNVIKALIELGKIPDNSNHFVENGDINTNNGNEKFHKGLVAVESLLGETVANKIEFTPGKGKGLYAISIKATGSTFSPMAVYVSPDFTGLSITAKGSKDQVKKEITEQDDVKNTSVSVGDVVPFKITDMYPFFATNATDRVYTLKDTVNGGTINGESLEVKIGDTLVYSNEEIKENDAFKENGVVVEENGFTLNFAYNKAYAGQEVTVTYTVTVTAGSELKNTVESEKDKNKTQSIVISPKVNAEIKKTDDQDNLLSDAEFTLYVETTSTDNEANYVLVSESTGTGEEAKTVYHIEARVSDKQYEEGTIFLKVVDTQRTGKEGEEGQDKGIAKFTQLDADKTYWVVETEAPDGYSLNNDAVKLQKDGMIVEGTPTLVQPDSENGYTMPTWVTENTVAVIDGKPAVFEATIIDTNLSALPSTGGIGTTIFTVGGCAIMILAAGLFFASRRKAMK